MQEAAGAQTAIRQTEFSVGRNASFFLGELDAYRYGIHTIDTYAFIRQAINESINGAVSLLDIGNGGVFDYDTTLAKSIVAVDLFLNDLPGDYACPDNVTLKQGDAIALPEGDGSHDTVLIVMLLHHLIGETISGSLKNIERVISEAWRVLSPGGRLVIVESCVPKWFYRFEQVIFPVATAIISASLKHPPTLQFPKDLIEQTIERVTGRKVSTHEIPRGKWVLQYGYKWLSALTPVSVWRFVVIRT